VRTVPIGVVGELIRGDAFYWGQLMAGRAPRAPSGRLIYSFFVKYYVAGLTAGAVKG
jgi:multiple sugar transport system permease protein